MRTGTDPVRDCRRSRRGRPRPGLRAPPQGAAHVRPHARTVGGGRRIRRGCIRAGRISAWLAAPRCAPATADVRRLRGSRPAGRRVGQGAFGGSRCGRRVRVLHRDVRDLPARDEEGSEVRPARAVANGEADGPALGRRDRDQTGPGRPVPAHRRPPSHPHRPGCGGQGGLPAPHPPRAVHAGDECAAGRGRRRCGALGVDVGRGSLLGADVPRGWSARACRRDRGWSRLHRRVRRGSRADSGAGDVRLTLGPRSQADGSALTRAGRWE